MAGTYIKIAKAHLAKNDKDPAMEAYQKAIILHPENKEAAEALKNLTGAIETTPDTMHK